MNVPIISFFNNKGGVGKTSLVYHIAWMLSELDKRVVAFDLDPQANLTANFIEEDKLEDIFQGPESTKNIYGCITPLIKGLGDIVDPQLTPVSDNLGIVAGSLNLSQFEDQLSDSWPKCADEDERAFRVISAFYRIMQKGAEKQNASVILADLGPNLGAINRSILIASDYVVIPLASDLFSLQGLQNLGPTLKKWRKQWDERKQKKPHDIDFDLPEGSIEPIGYILMQHAVRLDRPVQSYQKWAQRIPETYNKEILDLERKISQEIRVENDPNCLASLKHYRSLMAMSQEARKPVFNLKPADGAIGTHFNSVKDIHREFKELSEKILDNVNIKNASFG